jgi:hypothetical protein
MPWPHQGSLVWSLALLRGVTVVAVRALAHEVGMPGNECHADSVATFKHNFVQFRSVFLVFGIFPLNLFA